MPSTSKSNRRRSNKSKFVPKPKQEWRVKQPTRNWLELPSDLMVNILQRVGVIDVLENAHKVCTAWREICKDPAMWRIIHMDKSTALWGIWARSTFQKICKHAVNRSQGQLVDIKMIAFCKRELLQYVADRSSQLRRLEVIFGWGDMCGHWGESLKKLSLLEELSFGAISHKDIEAAGRYCPLLKTLKVNQATVPFWESDDDDEGLMTTQNDIALAIGKNLPQLTHLELVGNVTNTGLQAILDGCCHLESLDLSRCLSLDLKGDLGKRCVQQIKHLKLPDDSLEGRDILEPCDFLDDSDDYDYGVYSDYDYDDYFDYDNYSAYMNDPTLEIDYSDFINDGSMDVEKLSEVLAFRMMFE